MAVLLMSGCVTIEPSTDGPTIGAKTDTTLAPNAVGHVEGPLIDTGGEPLAKIVDTGGSPIVSLDTDGAPLVESDGLGRGLRGGMNSLGKWGALAWVYGMERGAQAAEDIADHLVGTLDDRLAAEGEATRAMIDDRAGLLQEDLTTAMFAPDVGVLHKLAEGQQTLADGQKDLGANMGLLAYAAVGLSVFAGVALLVAAVSLAFYLRRRRKWMSAEAFQAIRRQPVGDDPVSQWFSTSSAAIAPKSVIDFARKVGRGDEPTEEELEQLQEWAAQ